MNRPTVEDIERYRADLCHEGPDNTWVFTGGVAVEGPYSRIGGARHFVGHFEEYIRFVVTQGSDNARQRYTINLGREGTSLADVVGTFESRVAPLRPRVVSYTVGVEDYSQGAQGCPSFVRDLSRFIETATRDGRYVVVQSAANPEDEAAAAYSHAASTVVDEWRSSHEGARVIFIDTLWESKQIPQFASLYLDASGELNARGHQFMARSLAASTVGFFQETAFPASDVLMCHSVVDNDEGAALLASLWGLTVRDRKGSVGKENMATRLAERISQSAPMTWLFIGDSITHAALHTKGYDGHTQFVEKYLKESLGRTLDVVVNTGVSGATAATTVANMYQRVSRFHADVAIVMLGTNDCVTDGTTVESYRADLTKILRELRAANPEVLIALRTPTPGSRSREVEPYVACVRELVAENPDIALIDHFATWSAQAERFPWLLDAPTDPTRNCQFIFGDPLHPGINGHILLAHEILSGLGVMSAESAMYGHFYPMPLSLSESTARPAGNLDTETMTLRCTPPQESRLASEGIGAFRYQVCDRLGEQIYGEAVATSEGVIRLRDLPEFSDNVVVTLRCTGYRRDVPQLVRYAPTEISLA
ncbi:SGNH/GDSL hydrolase family protein [Arcanobacterium haemolyticum]|nr:SGNH/GDSL hydrolase family protein [Arcanobacterium haemolyticum]